MHSHTLLFRFTHFFLVTLLTSISSTSPHKIPRLSVFHETITRGTSKTISTFASEDLETFFYPQTLDHFNYQPGSYATFKQRYVINYKHWGGANESAPIFVYLGDEAPIDGQLELGFLIENAPHFKALQVYIEHRFYGESIPFGTMEDAMNSETTRGYFNSAQALADSAELIIYLKKKLSAYNSPVIVSGGSYGGMLAAWFRLKYPHVALGALASSAPILYFDDITPDDAYITIVTKDFRDLKNYLIGMYTGAAQYDEPPSYPVARVCGGIDGAKGNDVLGKIFAGIVGLNGIKTCYVNPVNNTPSETDIGWNWQACSEMVIPIGVGGKDSMFQPDPFNLQQYIMDCTSFYGVPPRPNWATTYYGGYDIKLVLQRFASNIIFSNGLRDPFSSGGVLEDLSDTLLAVYTANGSHCLDILMATETDPQWLIEQRKVEVKIIEGWLKTYYADFRALT
ncbi:hypothetical protein RHSIM_Rhsim13G0102700 [Rhododendron simsii]|uniref:Lysosomal Pro-X carboxypeptidase n=1 Tax=Rhododendron simsii TaxID=118357 RepID=A0A834G6Z0_RHOSS|nr:hypothetical protein RHSIM_Rhsim13G0102700 [Rhododendron simsii]